MNFKTVSKRGEFPSADGEFTDSVLLESDELFPRR